MIISKVRHFILKYHLGLFMACSVLLFSCTKEKVAADNIKNGLKTISATMSSISNEDLFRSIVFANGSFVDQIESLQEIRSLKNLFLTDTATVNKENQIEDAITNDIATNDSAFLPYFRAEITSGDHVRIAYAIDSAADVMFASFCKIQGLTTSQTAQLKTNVHSLNDDDFIDLERTVDDLNAGLITQDEAMAKIKADYPNIQTSLLNGVGDIGGTSAPPSQLACVALGWVLAIAVVVVGYVALALAAHTVIGARYAVVYTVHVQNTEPKKISTQNNISMVLIDDIANYSF